MKMREKNYQVSGIIMGLVTLLSVIPTNASASLISRPGGMVYDTDRNITWLADADYARTSGYTGAGMNWADANTWAASLTVGGFHDWRLPTTLRPDASCTGQYGEYNCTGSELGHLFYQELGGVARNSIFAIHNANLKLFSHLSAMFYSGTDYDSSYSWGFSMGLGQQGISDKSSTTNYGAWAVRTGDVGGATQATPLLPTTLCDPILATGLCFTNVNSGQWFDPPITSAINYVMDSSALFTAIADFPTGFISPFTVSSGGSVLGVFGPGQSFTFPGTGVSEFTISGISPDVDLANSSAFPLKMDFSAPTASFHMFAASVPEPETWLLLTAGLGIIVGLQNRKSRVGRATALSLPAGLPVNAGLKDPRPTCKSVHPA